MEYTKGVFKDGRIGWKIANRETNGVKGYEIHWSDDGECITDHVYTKEDAKLIASAPQMYEALKEIAQGKGRYDTDKLIHASNTIEDMIKIAKDAIPTTHLNNSIGK